MSNHSVIDDLARGTTKEVTEEVKRWIANQGIEDEIQADAAEMARIAARHILDPNQPPLKDFPRIPLDLNTTTEEDVRYMLIQEFLQSAGFNFTSNVLKYESQCPEFPIDRDDLGAALGFPSYDRTPFLVQIIEERLRKQQEQQDM
ncbi:hypothetical protein TVAG_198790 [Trichomonas vaginalis G3]|uniref:LisH domain-containing protein n=1 Tax=Trichomonas vaginalis (strain ATCC PRA-98 / G3) TaxID=412133 RepID=A2DDR4_TRIV3|nr:hypothetical protein TVAGG3_0999220 [Trichomonas vaginalis G3]EAY21440.1 hypothetical protein TVAG_198790 [Trichomonas vaginalis G3]KAI5490653.1 hypothetical protein TVAGG3_0999220 [Trichomonas vaginalis G3]|eukprot:XP_001582426.1 hypothetical protein [Trichomonas vaginalis G3]